MNWLKAVPSCSKRLNIRYQQTYTCGDGSYLRYVLGRLKHLRWLHELIVIQRRWQQGFLIYPPLHCFKRLISFPLGLHQFINRSGFNPYLMIASTPHWWVIFDHSIPPCVPSRVMRTCPQLVARVYLYRFLFYMRAAMRPTSLSLIWTSLFPWIVAMLPYRPRVCSFWCLRIYKWTLLHVMHYSHIRLVVQSRWLVFHWHLPPATRGSIECVVAKGRLREHWLELVVGGDFGH